MSKYNTQYRQVRPKQRGLHPIWSGIGCLLILVVPVLSFGIASIVAEAIKSRLPYWMFAPIYLPALMYYYTPTLVQILEPILTNELIVAKLIFTVIIIILIAGVLSFVYALIYRAIGPSRYSPLDAPPTGRKVKRYRR